MAIAELVDNAIQAEATTIEIVVNEEREEEYPISISITDNGHGMAPATLAKALAFGGSSRFGDRSSLGRFGMGLPNASLSQAKRVDVFTWHERTTLHCYLDLDELARQENQDLPPVRSVEGPQETKQHSCGTRVELSRCDRLEFKRASTIASKLKADLGRTFRHFIDGGICVRVNAETVEPIDHLFQTGPSGGTKFGETLIYELSGPSGSGVVEVCFVELPVLLWHKLPEVEKRRLGITGTSTVSVVRAGREIDRGWLLMGKKRRENYDAWWRCEIRFEPILDELFGVTHTKQQVSFSEELRMALESDLESIGRALNHRVRQQFEIAKSTTPLVEAQRTASKISASLPPLPQDESSGPGSGIDPVRGALPPDTGDPLQLFLAELSTTALYDFTLRDGALCVFLNIRHPILRDIYQPLAYSDQPTDQKLAKNMALVLLAAARAEVRCGANSANGNLRWFRQEWSDVTATFLNA